ncbi:hypothetical protein [Achromobacter xylosoxidans]|uniref:hypothetical protein n=1 Tax=Alcaligenes xylosoxydans xylosoxydans TaxID=85698 RepID=UPI001F10D97E|nr:hypothetical protein [Achromobacter xylosoxidans]MCH4582485.1 hypothetical protein [Achromobacter xylosoxidans]
MADYGLRVRNLNNEIQIGSDFRNVAVRSAGVLALTGQISWVNRVYGAALTLPVGATGLVAFRCQYPAVIYGASVNGNDVTYYFRADTGGVAGASLYWYLLDEIAKCPPPAGHYGMVVKDAAGNVTYDSRQRYARFVDSFRLTSGQTAFYPGSQIAVIQAIVPSNSVSTGFTPPPTTRWNYNHDHGFILAWGNQLSVNRVFYKFGEGNTLVQWPAGNPAIFAGTLIDVSGL